MSYKVTFGPERLWFTSDTHFGHANIIRYCGRPFASVEEMDAALIANWNERVGAEDTVFHLGDFGWRNRTRNEEIFRQLHGTKYLVIGNHDEALMRHSGWRYLWAAAQERIYLKVTDPGPQGDSQLIVLDHFPLESWDRAYHGSWHLHGHTHGTLPSAAWMKRADAGVDAWDMRPFSYAELKALMATKNAATERGDYYA